MLLFGKTYLQKEYQKDLLNKVTNLPEESGLAGVRGTGLIPLVLREVLNFLRKCLGWYMNIVKKLQKQKFVVSLSVKF